MIRMDPMKGSHAVTAWEPKPGTSERWKACGLEQPQKDKRGENNEH